MKAITIKQPWASLIALGVKNFETRSWKTKYRGPIAIHAGKSIDREACEDIWIKKALSECGINTPQELPTGSVIAIAQLIDCHQVRYNFCNQAILTSGPRIHGLEVHFGDYTKGRYAWELSEVQLLLEPIPAKGQLSLWEWDDGR